METSGDQTDTRNSRTGSGKSGADVATDRGQATDADGLPVQRGFLMGVGAFIVGFAFTYLSKSGEVSESISGANFAVFGSEPEGYQVIGWIYTVMHHAEVQMSGGGQSVTMGASDLEEGWLVLVPIVALLAAGYLVATRTPDHLEISGPKAGATIVTGYLVCVIALVLVSEWSTTANSVDITAKPKTGETIAVAGIAYPIILGFIGGAIGDS